MTLNTKTLKVFELLTAKIFHDFAGTVGAIINCVEFLDGEVVNDDIMSLLKESSEDILIKFKLLKQAYSFSESNLSFDETRENIEKYLLKKKITLNWKEKGSLKINDDLFEKINKIIANLVILAISFMIKGKEITIFLEQLNNHQILLYVNILAEKVEISEFILNILTQKKEPEIIQNLDIKSIQAYFISVLLNKNHINITKNSEDNVSINIELT